MNAHRLARRISDSYVRFLSPQCSGSRLVEHPQFCRLRGFRGADLKNRNRQALRQPARSTLTPCPFPRSEHYWEMLLTCPLETVDAHQADNDHAEDEEVWQEGVAILTFLFIIVGRAQVG